MTTSTVTITYTESGTLTSQEGVRGRPRKNGRVHVRGASLPAKETHLAVARAFEMKPSHITPYPRESGADCLAFVVPGLGKDDLMIFSAEVTVAEDAPAVDAAPAAEPAADVSAES